MVNATEEIKKETASAEDNKAGIAGSTSGFPVSMKVYKLKDLKPFSREIIKSSGENINNCYQCKKCSNGCPITYAMDIQPHLIIKMIQLGMEKEVLGSKTIWLCAACETCGTRCPNEIKLADMMDSLRQMAETKGYVLGQKNASIFHKSFLDSIEKYGRVYEIGMIRDFTIKASGLFGKFFDGSLMRDGKLGIKLIKKGKLGFSPHKIKGTAQIKEIFKKLKRG